MDDKLMIMLDEEALFQIFFDFGVIENQMANFLLIIEALQEHFEDGMLNDKYAILLLMKSQITLFHKEIYDNLRNADALLLKKNNRFIKRTIS